MAKLHISQDDTNDPPAVTTPTLLKKFEILL